LVFRGEELVEGVEEISTRILTGKSGMRVSASLSMRGRQGPAKESICMDDDVWHAQLIEKGEKGSRLSLSDFG
jgi:hypothetical protein